jgi:hypothetical protein
MDYIKPLRRRSFICYTSLHRFATILAQATSGEDADARWRGTCKTGQKPRFHANVIEYISAAASTLEGFMASQSVAGNAGIAQGASFAPIFRSGGDAIR